MSNLKWSSVLLCLGLVLVSIGCQEGKKKDSGSSAIEQGTKDNEQLEKDLLALGIQIDGPSPTEDKASTALPSNLKRIGSKSRDRAQLMLEKYVISTKKLLGLADEKVVVYSDKQLLAR
ncbi:MAG: hypothetical protein AAB250_04080, partial [Bdellovibrionota bacterium]